MGQTIVEKILSRHAQAQVQPGDIADIAIDVRCARDFGGANVVSHLRKHALALEDPQKTFFTFDCNPGGSDQKYAKNQHICRLFAREQGIKVFDINQGIGTHLAIDEGLVVPGSTFVSTDSHANILGAIGAFGQGMGDVDIAYAMAHGRVWFKVPPTVLITLKGTKPPQVSAKDIGLFLLKHFGAGGLLGMAAELTGPIVQQLDLDSRITIASLATEMAGIIILFAGNETTPNLAQGGAVKGESILADSDANYERQVTLDITDLTPQISRPGHPEDVVSVSSLLGTQIDSAFIGSCTNGRLSDLRAAAAVLKDRHVAPGCVLKIVPATDQIWQAALREGLIEIFKNAGALVGNAGCAGCAEGQIGQNGPGEVSISTGNRNFTGKQGQGEVYLASPAIAAASAVVGEIALPEAIPAYKARVPKKSAKIQVAKSLGEKLTKRPTRLEGRVWVISADNVDTDMIFHNRHLAITDIKEMGRYALGNLKGFEDFGQKAKPGDIIVAGKNFGAGSSRQQAVDCFIALGISAILAESFGAIYERNAINAGLPILVVNLKEKNIKTGDHITIDLESSAVDLPTGERALCKHFSQVQMNTYQKGGLL